MRATRRQTASAAAEAYHKIDLSFRWQTKIFFFGIVGKPLKSRDSGKKDPWISFPFSLEIFPPGLEIFPLGLEKFHFRLINTKRLRYCHQCEAMSDQSPRSIRFVGAAAQRALASPPPATATVPGPVIPPPP